MAKNSRLTLADRIELDTPEPSPVSRDPVNAQSRKDVKRPHQSVYASAAVFQALKMIAVKTSTPDNRVTQQSLMCDGIRKVLAEHGYDFDTLNNQ